MLISEKCHLNSSYNYINFKKCHSSYEIVKSQRKEREVKIGVRRCCADFADSSEALFCHFALIIIPTLHICTLQLQTVVNK